MNKTTLDKKQDKQEEEVLRPNHEFVLGIMEIKPWAYWKWLIVDTSKPSCSWQKWMKMSVIIRDES